MIREWVGTADSPPGTPNDVAVDDAGRLYVTDRATGQIHVYDGSGNWRSSFGQYLKYLGTESEQPIATWVDVDRHGDIWVATEDADSPPMWMSLGGGVVRHSNDGRVLDYWFSSSRGILGNPTEVHVDPSGNVIVSSDWDRWLHVYGPDGTYLTGWGRTGPDGTRFQTFGDFAVGPDGDVWVAGRDGITVTRFTQPYGTPKDEWIVREPQDQHEAWSLRLTIADDGSVLLATSDSLLRFSEDGELLREWSWPEAVVEVIEVDSHADRLYALVGRLGEPFRSVLIYDLDGELMDEWLRWTSADEGGFGSTSDLAVGSDGAVYFADTNVNGIIVCNADGSFRTIAGEMDYQNGFWMGPTGVTVDRFGNLYAIESPKGLLKLVWLP
jgi:sugar lactone lactonase YvrE